MLRDSKKMTHENREKTYEEILFLVKQEKLAYAVGIIDNAMIDKVGIREANRLAMEEALRTIK